jgi:hypothetical protein
MPDSPFLPLSSSGPARGACVARFCCELECREFGSNHVLDGRTDQGCQNTHIGDVIIVGAACGFCCQEATSGS